MAVICHALASFSAKKKNFFFHVCGTLNVSLTRQLGKYSTAVGIIEFIALQKPLIL